MRRAINGPNGVTKSTAVARFTQAGLPFDPAVRYATWIAFVGWLHDGGLITTDQRDGWTYPWGRIYVHAREAHIKELDHEVRLLKRRAAGAIQRIADGEYEEAIDTLRGEADEYVNIVYGDLEGMKAGPHD